MKILKAAFLWDALEAMALGAVPIWEEKGSPFYGGRGGGLLLCMEEVESLKWISIRGDDLVIGSMATWRRIAESPLVARYVPLLALAASRCCADGGGDRRAVGGSVWIPSSASVGLCSLWALGARVELGSVESTRKIPLTELVTGAGLSSVRPGELLTAITLPMEGLSPFLLAPDGVVPSGASLGSCSAAFRRSPKDGRIDRITMVLGSMGPLPVRSEEAESLMKGTSFTDRRPFLAAGDALCDEIARRGEWDRLSPRRRKMVRLFPRLFRRANLPWN